MSFVNPRLERIKPILACPRCIGDLNFSAESAACENCQFVYPIRSGKIYFVEVSECSDHLHELKGRLKRRLGNYYYSIGVTLFAPTYPFNLRRWIRRYLDPRLQAVVDVGCGNHRLDEDIIGLDFVDYDAVDVVCDVQRLPFKTRSVDAFVSRALLEHVPDPAMVIRDFRRCTKPGGLGFHVVPFLFPFHASPDDFQRYTHRGLELLFQEWAMLVRINPTGPVTLALLTIIEFLSVLFSLGRDRLKSYLYLLLCGILFPLKYLDAPFVGRRSFLSLAPTIFIVVRNDGQPAML